MSPPNLAQPPKRTGPEPFGKYLLLDRIGIGGMAEVFRAVASGPEGFRRTVVIKRILPTLSEDEGFVRMLVDEAKLCALLSHPNLVQVHELGQVDDSYYIAMEYVHGRTLSMVQNKLIQHGRKAPVAAAVEITRQICVGLHYAHNMKGRDGKPLGIVHRDVSPSNVMIAFHGVVKVLDFGIARVANGLRQNRTQAGMVKGKTSYMSPEQVLRDDIDHRSDVFSTGIVLHEMLTGRRLFRASNDFGAGRNVMELPIPLPSALNPSVSPALDRIVMRALERKLDERYATAAQLGADLDQLMQDERLSPRDHTKLLVDMFPDEASQHDPGIDVMPEPSAATGMATGAGNAEAARTTPTVEALRLEAPAGLATPPPRPVPAPGFGPPPVPRPSVAMAPVALVAPEAAPSKAPRWIALGLGAVGVAALAAWLVFTQRPLPAEPPRSMTESPPIAGSAANSDAKATTVRCSIDSEPQDVVVKRVSDGSVLGRTPFTAAFPRSERPIQIRFERAGQRSIVRKVIPDMDKVVRVTFAEPKAAPPPPPPRRAPPAAPAHKRNVPSAKALHDATPLNPFMM